jgi:hypothetical protein
LVKSTLGLHTSCSEQNELPSNTAIVSSSASLVFAVVNIGLAENVSYSSINGQLYSQCWNAFPISGARFDEGMESDEPSLQQIENVEASFYPNPTQGYSTVDFYTATEQNAALNIYDTQGKLVFTKVIEAAKGQNKVALDLSTLNRGLYLAILSADGYEGKSVRIIKN